MVLTSQEAIMAKSFKDLLETTVGAHEEADQLRKTTFNFQIRKSQAKDLVTPRLFNYNDLRG